VARFFRRTGEGVYDLVDLARAMFGNIAARREDRGMRHQLGAEAEELVLVAARAVQNHEEG
jgi:hypothetical protein